MWVSHNILFTLEGKFLELWLRFKVCVCVGLKTLVLVEIYRSSVYNKRYSHSLLLYWAATLLFMQSSFQRWAKFHLSDPSIPAPIFGLYQPTFSRILEATHTIATPFEINVHSKGLVSLHIYSSKLADFKAIYSFYRLNMFVEGNCYASSLQNDGF
jgi:hypothetical protein